MRFLLPWLLCVLSLLLPLACKDQESNSVQKQALTVEQKLEEGQRLMAEGFPERAVKSFREASGLQPDSTEALLLLAEAHRRSGNRGAAILALKQVSVIDPSETSFVQRQLAEVYERDGLIPQAVETLLELRDSEQLEEEDLLHLARLQARQGQPEEAFKTLERIQRERPDDPDAKVVEAEILLIKGEELLAANLMDRLLTEKPELVSARLLRARYFLNNGYPELAEQDLGLLQGEASRRPEVLALRARVLHVLGRYAEAESLLSGGVAGNPDDAELLAWLAETKLYLGRLSEAQSLVERALRQRPQFARALYVRARALEGQGNLRRAMEDYRYSLSSDPGFSPALARMWRLHRQLGDEAEALSTLERLVGLGEASLEEKVSLAEIYARQQTRQERGLKLIEEALRRDKGNARYLAIKKQLEKTAPRKKKKKRTGPVILRGGR